MQFIEADAEFCVAAKPTEKFPFTRVFYDLNMLCQMLRKDIEAKQVIAQEMGDPEFIAGVNGQALLVNALISQRDVLMLEADFSV